MSRYSAIKEIVRLANVLDTNRYYKEADTLTKVASDLVDEDDEYDEYDDDNLPSCYDGYCKKCLEPSNYLQYPGEFGDEGEILSDCCRADIYRTPKCTGKPVVPGDRNEVQQYDEERSRWETYCDSWEDF